MATKKPGFFAGLFGRKKSNKENEAPVEANREFHRTQSVRGSRRHRSSRFDDGGFSPEHINPYHGNVKPRQHPKGPQSCPGGYRDEDRYDDSYEESRSVVHHGRMHGRHDKYRRSARDTSEYGSGDPSPIANMSRHPHYNTSLIEDSDPEDYGKYAREADLFKENQHLKTRLVYFENRKEYYKAQCRRLKSAKEEIERAYTDRVEALKSELAGVRQELGKTKGENANFRNELMSLKGHARPTQHFSNFQTSMYTHTPVNQMYPGPLSQPLYSNNNFTPRLQFIDPMSHSVITPGTSSTLESSTAGAGEALAQQTDLSFRPSSVSYMNPVSESSFSTQQEEDDIKQFHCVEDDEVLGMEVGRADVSSSSLGMHRQEEVQLRHNNDSHASSSTMVAEESLSPCPPMKSRSTASIRRTASDGVLN